ncbi:MAG TPA: PAS domain S-box protein [Patescibacteria group bacterium]|nr:PAS domain S-box protein [Patescibacteria group bacterium]
MPERTSQEQENRLNAALAELSAAIISPWTTFDAVYQLVLEKARWITDSEHGFVSSIEPQSGAHISNTLTQMRRQGCTVTSGLYALPQEPHHTYAGLWGHSLNIRAAFFTNQPLTHPAAKGLPAGHLQLNNYLAVPAMFGDQLLGQIALANSPRDYTEKDLARVERLAALYALVLHNRRQEEKLRSGEERLRFALEGSGDGIWDWDITRDEVYFSPRWKNMLGYAEDECSDSVAEWKERTHPEDRSAVREEMNRCLEGATQKFVSEHRVRCKNGQYKWILDRGRIVARDEGGAPLRIVGTYTDIDELRRMQQALRESEARFRALVMQSSDAVILVDVETHEIVEVNHCFEKLLGYRLPTDQPLAAEALVADSPANIQKHFDTAYQNGVLPRAMRSFRTKDGGRRQMERTASLIRLGRRDYLIVTLRDVTEEQKWQQVLQNDLAFAGKVQVALLPVLPETDDFTIQTLFRPNSFVSGDLYHLDWQAETRVLRGCLIDVTGHGLATAIQTAAVNVLLHAASALNLSVEEQLNWLNWRVPRYFAESAFAAAIAFEIDFSAGEMRYAAAGITDFLLNGDHVQAPGLFLGLKEYETFPARVVPFGPGDTVCFMTDGFSDYLTQEDLWRQTHARDVCRMFARDVFPEALPDDATAICVTARG